MKLYINTAYKYVKYYISRSLSIMVSMVLSIALIIGIGTLSKSAKQADMDKMIYENGSYHAVYKDINKKQTEIILKNKKVHMVGFTQYYDSGVEDRINLIRTDENYVKLCNSKLLQGRMPNKEGEIALEPWVISNLNLKSDIGEKITIKLYKKNRSETYTLVGIVQDRVNEKRQGIIQGFLSIQGITTGKFDSYVQFDGKKNIISSITNLQKAGSIKDKKVFKNSYLFESIGALDTQDHKTMLTAIIISVFAGLVIYSIFNISIMQRISEYGTLKAIGAKSFQIFKFLFSELILLLLISIPIGILLGFFGAKGLSSFTDQLFTEGEVRISKVIISQEAMLLAMGLLIIVILAIAIVVSFKMKKISAISAITKNIGNSELRKVTKAKLLKNFTYVTFVISYKNIKKNKRAFFITIGTIVIGGIIFIVANFGANLLRIDTEERLMLDPSLNSDFKISSGILDSKTAVSKKKIEQMRNLEGVKSIDSIQLKYSGLIINEDKVVFPNFFDKDNKTYANIFNGMFTKVQSTDNYLLKNSIFGYNNDLLSELKPYLLDGKIDIDRMNNEDVVLLRMPRDGEKNYVFRIKAGDKIKVKFLKDTKMDGDTVKMPDNLDYMEKEFIVGGIISDIPTYSDYYIINSAEVILSNKKFEQIMGYSNYSIVNIHMVKNADHKKLNNEIGKIVKNVPGCAVRDMVIEKGEVKSYNNQKLGFVYAITLILFIIGLFNIMNNISYSLVSRISEFSIIRAIGLDNKGFKRMIQFEGLVYGGISAILTLIGSLIGQIVLYNIVKNEYINPKFTINYKLYIVIILFNLFIGFFATYLPSRKIKNQSIVEAINNLI